MPTSCPAPGDELVLWGGDQPGLRYPLDPAVWLATACQIAGRDLTRAESADLPA